MKPLALWAGPECTVNRVGDEFHDQLVQSGVDQRLEDMDRLCALGIECMRFPLLWERTAPNASEPADWRWADTRLARLRELGVAPIAGLLHHGSGPRYTHLLDPLFPEHFARYAAEVARRYPWINSYTPINEVLTTARFSALYGHWYPHHSDDRSFVRALLNQVQAVVLAMRAVRTVNPAARLVQTEDLGFVRSSESLRYQAEFENKRRWLSFDLLCGRVDARHPLRRYLRRHGATEQELQELVDAPCPPDVLGINFYVTSERFLDDRIQLYPRSLHGGNGRQAYVDVELARVRGHSLGGFEERLRESGERYGLPMAITEAHLGCTRDEQARWLHQAWAAARTVRAEGHEVQAVTAWAAFGAFDWNSLLTRRAGHYEPGLFDVSHGLPRPTALAQLARALARGEEPDLPALDGPGWWQRELRYEYPPQSLIETLPLAGRPLLICGSGTLGRAFARLCLLRGLPHRLLSRSEVDIADPVQVAAVLDAHRPWALINTAGYVRVDDAERDPRQWRENVLGPEVLAAQCEARGIRFVTFSSDLVFKGEKSVPYVESDAPAPLNAYGQAKRAAEQRVAASSRSGLVIRTAAFFGPWDNYNFVTQGLQAVQDGQPWRAIDDQRVSPTYVPDLVQATLDLLIDRESGVWHLSNRGCVSWLELAQMATETAGLPRSLVQPVSTHMLQQTAARPAYSALGSERARLLPTLEDALARYLTERQRHGVETAAMAATAGRS